MKLEQIAANLHTHLKRMEADKAINKKKDGRTLPPFFQAGAFRNGRWVAVRYISFQGYHNLRREQAEEYLQWLDAGNNGKHVEVQSGLGLRTSLR